MNLKTLNFHRCLYFLLISIFGVSYLAFLVFFTPKVYSGFLMQVIFLIDALVVHPQNIFSLISRPDVLIQISVGFFWSYLLLRALKAIFKTSDQIQITHKFVQSLNIIQITNQYSVFKSLKPEAFTVGFSRPQIFLSRGLFKISNPTELSSILLHEQSHQLNRDPLKNLLVEFINNLLPVFPAKSWLFGQYLTLVEVCADTYSSSNFNHSRSLISALLKIQNFTPPSFVIGFSTQSERIKILTGHKSPPLRSTVLANLLAIVLLFVISGSLYRTDIFYQCSHLLKCFENLITPDHIVTVKPTENYHCLYQ